MPVNFRKILTFKVNDDPENHSGRLGEITFHNGYLYYHDGETRQIIGGGGTGGPTSWASITGKPNLSTVATSGSYADLIGKPNLATVATSGDYNDLTNKPTLTTGPQGPTGATGPAEVDGVENYFINRWQIA